MLLSIINPPSLSNTLADYLFLSGALAILKVIHIRSEESKE